MTKTIMIILFSFLCTTPKIAELDKSKVEEIVNYIKEDEETNRFLELSENKCFDIDTVTRFFATIFGIKQELEFYEKYKIVNFDGLKYIEKFELIEEFWSNEEEIYDSLKIPDIGIDCPDPDYRLYINRLKDSIYFVRIEPDLQKEIFKGMDFAFVIHSDGSMVVERKATVNY